MKIKDAPDENTFPLNSSTGYASVNIQKLYTVMLMYYGFTLDNGEVLCVCGSKVGDRPWQIMLMFWPIFLLFYASTSSLFSFYFWQFFF